MGLTEEKQRADIRRILDNALTLCVDFGYDRRLIDEAITNLFVDSLERYVAG
jgi:hypothetical protein